jgi:hypothetical protein
VAKATSRPAGHRSGGVMQTFVRPACTPGAAARPPVAVAASAVGVAVVAR